MMRPRIDLAGRRPAIDRRGDPDSASAISASAAKARSSRSTAMTRRAPSASSARVEPARPGTDLDHGDAVERAGGACDAAGEVEVEQEVLAERLLRALRSWRRITSRSGGEAVGGAVLARHARSMTGAAPAAIAGSGAQWSAAALAAPQASTRRPDSTGSARAAAGDVEGGAMVGRGAHEGQAERDVDAMVEGQGLDRDQRLVVIHAERHVVGRARAPAWNMVSAGSGPRASMPSARRRSIAGAHDRQIFLAERAVLAGMRVEAGDREPRTRDAEARRQIARHDAAGLDDEVAW